jgi:MYXO-CTERM domain-containing protein
MLGLATSGWVFSLQADPYVVTGGTTSVALDTDLVASVAGLTLVDVNNTVAPYSMDYDVGFAATGATNFTFASDLSLIAGSIEHLGTLTFSDVDSVLHTVGNFSLRHDPARESALLSGLYLVDTYGGLGTVFDLGVFSAPWVSGSAMTAGPATLYISPELGSVLLENEFTTSNPAGVAVGSAFFSGMVRSVASVPDAASTGVTGLAVLALAMAARFRRRLAPVRA